MHGAGCGAARPQSCRPQVQALQQAGESRVAEASPIRSRAQGGAAADGAGEGWADGTKISATYSGTVNVNAAVPEPGSLALTFAALALLVWQQPRRLRLWQRTGVTLVALYFSLSMLVFTLRPDPGPSLYTLGSFGPWAMGGLLLLFTTWRARVRRQGLSLRRA